MAFYPAVPAVVPRGDFSKPCSALQEMIKFEKRCEVWQNKSYPEVGGVISTDAARLGLTPVELRQGQLLVGALIQPPLHVPLNANPLVVQ